MASMSFYPVLSNIVGGVPAILKLRCLAIVLGLILCVAANEVQAQCASANNTNCTLQVCNARQAQVHPTCDVQRSCTNIAATAANRADLQTRLGRNQACLGARQNVGACYAVQDAGHQQQIQNVQNAITTCQNKINAIP